MFVNMHAIKAWCLLAVAYGHLHIPVALRISENCRLFKLRYSNKYWCGELHKQHDGKNGDYIPDELMMERVLRILGIIEDTLREKAVIFR